MFKVLFVMLLVLFPFEMNAQHKSSYGFRGGLNLSKVVTDFEGTLSQDINKGLNVGLTYQRELSSSYSYKTGLLYSQKGFISIDSESFIPNEYSSVFHYFDIPLLLSYQLDWSNTMLFFIDAGFYGSVLALGEVDYKAYKQKPTIGEAGKLKRLDGGYVVGAGVQVGQVQIGAQLSNAMVYANNNTFLYDIDFKNQVVAIYFNYLFYWR